jgi:hypothetical protein
MAATKPLTVAQLQGLIASLPKFCANTVFTLSGQTYTSASLVTLATAVLNAGAASSAAKASLAAARAAEEKSIAGDGVVVREARDTLALMFNDVPETLSAFAIAPRKLPRPLSAEARAAATAKLRATRLARGTTSKEQKAKISGNVTGVTIVPITSPASPAPAAATPAAPTPATPATGSGPVTATGTTAAHT